MRQNREKTRLLQKGGNSKKSFLRQEGKKRGWKRNLDLATRGKGSLIKDKIK